jgi:hypothetical protein
MSVVKRYRVLDLLSSSDMLPKPRLGPNTSQRLRKGLLVKHKFRQVVRLRLVARKHQRNTDAKLQLKFDEWIEALLSMRYPISEMRKQLLYAARSVRHERNRNESALRRCVCERCNGILAVWTAPGAVDRHGEAGKTGHAKTGIGKHMLSSARDFSLLGKLHWDPAMMANTCIGRSWIYPDDRGQNIRTVQSRYIVGQEAIPLLPSFDLSFPSLCC